MIRRVFTFGYGHTHPTTGKSLRGRYVVIEGETLEHCRAEMLNRFGREWAFEYASETAVRTLSAPARPWPLPPSEWPVGRRDFEVIDGVMKLRRGVHE